MNNRKLSRNVPAGYALRVRHIHDPQHLRDLSGHGRPPRYITQAAIYKDVRLSNGKLDVFNQDPVVETEARCSHRDNPDRKQGYHIAVIRALRALSEQRRLDRFVEAQPTKI